MKTPPSDAIAYSLFGGMAVRLHRAGEHLADLKTRLERLRQANIDQVINEQEPDVVYVGRIRVPPDSCYPMLPINGFLMISVVIGEIVHNLRSALDSLVYGLAWIDSKRFHKMTQFPIYSLEDDFLREGLSKLKGLSDEHIARIKELQPYNGCDWTRTLNRLSNRDKHRELIKVLPIDKFAMQLGVRMGEPLEPATNANAGDGRPTYHVEISDPRVFFNWVAENLDRVKVNLTLTGEITLSDGAPVIDTLEILESQVSNLLGEFVNVFLPWLHS